jgi:DnaJ-domain-containing protein 1
MSIGKRLFKLARSELNSLLDRAAEIERKDGPRPDPDEDLYRRFSLNQLTDRELEAEIERRHQARQAAKRGTQTSAPTAGEQQSGNARSSGGPRARRTSSDEDLRRAYAALEVPFGADFEAVRKSYRTLMRKYHPDRHASAPDKLKAATEVAQQLTQAYKLIEQRSRR